MLVQIVNRFNKDLLSHDILFFTSKFILWDVLLTALEIQRGRCA